MHTIGSLFFLMMLIACNSVRLYGGNRAIQDAVPIRTEQFLNVHNSSVTVPAYRSFQLFRDDAFSAETRGKSAIALHGFPVSERGEATVVLQKMRPVVDANTRLFAGNTPVNMPAVETWSGYIEGDEDSRVFLCKTGGLMIASIQHGNGAVYTLAPGAQEAANGTLPYILRQEGVQQKTDFICKASDMLHQLKASDMPSHSGKAERTLAVPLYEVEIAVEADTKFFTETGGTMERATAYLVSLLSLASVIYEDEVDVRFYLPWIKIWTNNPADPYNSNGSGYDLAPKALAYWGEHYQDVERDLVHVLTSGGGGGIGYQFPLSGGGAQTSLCTGSGLSASSPFADHVFPTLDFTYGVYIVAHELGHNFGAVHSHSCFWNPPLDTCLTRDDATHRIDDACYSLPVQPKPSSGSIMSYCANTNADLGSGYGLAMTFLPPVAAYMRGQIEQSLCIVEPPQPVVILTSPRGGERYAFGTPISITWKSARIQQFDLSYSADAGKTWQPIADGVTGSQMNWTGICGQNLLVRIADADNPAVADTSILTFSIEEQREDCLITEYLFSNGSMRSRVCGAPAVLVENAQPERDRTGVVYNAFLFSAIDKSRMVIPRLNFDKPEITVSFWFRPYNSMPSEFQSVVGTDWQEKAVFQVYVSNSRLNAAFWTKESGVPIQLAASKISLGNTWYFGTVSYDGEWAKIYCNGVLADSIRHKGTLQTGVAPVYIGARGTTEYFGGVIDDLRLHCRALTAKEIMELYQMTTTVPQAVVLKSPRDATPVDIDNTVLFVWEEMPTVAAYHLQVATDPNFAGTPIVDIDDLTTRSASVNTLELQRTYYWRVAARNELGIGPWSSTWSFVPVAITSVGEPGHATGLADPQPNPADDLLMAQYSLHLPGTICLGLYDSMGREVRTVDTGWKQPGVFHIHVPTASLPAGVYFLKLFAGDVVSSRKVVIAR